jgi:DNA-binding NarL/FixJ family response regulator
MSIRIVLADDHPIFRDGLVRSLEETGRFAVVGAGATADEAVALTGEHRPDLVLLDISMPGGGVDAARPHPAV